MGTKSKNMGTVGDLIKAAPKGTSISDGIRTYTQEEALKAEPLKDLLNQPVHAIKEGVLYIEKNLAGRPVKVMAVRLVKP